MSDPTLLLKLDRPVPRYTSYPTAPAWGALDEATYRFHLKRLEQNKEPISLYFHIPFCKTMCLYCGCSVVLNRKPENEARYVNYLIKEIELITALIGQKKVSQLHFGGGTPTQLSIPLFKWLYQAISSHFDLSQAQEIAIEIDPRTVVEDNGEKLKFLRGLGFNRVSFGVQDTNPKVQEAVKRHQSLEMTLSTYHQARELGFQRINIDLIYGLPYQTAESFAKTTEEIVSMRPDRIAFFSYAKVPWLKPHQKAIKDELLPSVKEKFQIYADARSRFIEAGYVAIGMDHFALSTDELSHAYKAKQLQRNFQGYSLKLSKDILSFGVTAIGLVEGAYIQNLKDLNSYYAALDKNSLPIHRGKVLSEEDDLRKWVIHTLMCDFELNKLEFEARYHSSFDHHFANVADKIEELAQDGLVINAPDKLTVTSLGELFVRIVASTFDAYLIQESPQPQFSQSV